MGEIDRRTITFTVQELWLLTDFVRHEMPDMERFKYPPADLELNEEIALAILACTEDNLTDYTLDLTKQQLLVIDYTIRHDYKNAMMAKGRDVLLKVFRARRELAFGYEIGGTDRTYQEEVRDANSSRNPDRHPDGIPADDA